MRSAIHQYDTSIYVERDDGGVALTIEDPNTTITADLTATEAGRLMQALQIVAQDLTDGGTRERSQA